MTKTFLKDETGSAAIEYSLLGALVALAAIIALEALGTSLSSMFGGISGKVKAIGAK